MGVSWASEKKGAQCADTRRTWQQAQIQAQILLSGFARQNAETGWRNAARNGRQVESCEVAERRGSAGTLPAVSRATGLPRRAGSKPAIRQTGRLRYDPGAARGSRDTFRFRVHPPLCSDLQKGVTAFLSCASTDPVRAKLPAPDFFCRKNIHPTPAGYAPASASAFSFAVS